MHENLHDTSSEELSVKEVVNKIRALFAYLKTKKIGILLFAIAGFLVGLGYCFMKKPVYKATCTFVLEDSQKSSGLGQYSALASLAGVDISGGGGGGIFNGDNILALYKSRTMIEKTLLCPIDVKSSQLLIDKYIEFNNLRAKWDEKPELKNIRFNTPPEQFNRHQDSIITDIVKTINSKLLSVAKPDKKQSIIEVSVSTKNEVFSKAFTDNLVENVNSFYVQTKTKKTLQSVRVLQYQRDSVRTALNGALNGVASSIDATPNANPALLTLRVPSQRKQVDVQTSATLYAEIVKNLELSKISLRQETPLIQVLDSPVFPLEADKPNKIKTSVIGLVLGALLAISWLVFKRIYNHLVA